MKASLLRKTFLDFFAKQGHTLVPSSSLLPSDPSVLFTTAGMQQFKQYFLGEKTPYRNKATSCQKCFRTSDIDEVGDKDHLTFLEMLGNFSFGDYFKTEAIKLAYEFLFKELKMSLEDAVFTVFAGDGDVPEDKKSTEIWKSLGIPQEKIMKCSREDNFWGPTGKEGPCGPTTEIHLKGVEIWNLVFNEYYQDKNGKLTPLKQKGVDTGMGLERLAMIVQDKPSVFETDLFEPILKLISDSDIRVRRITADHIKGAVFLISEGILPSNVERGYVLRRVLRRAIRYGKLLNLPKNFLIPLAQKVIEIYQDVYPEVKSKEADILTVIQNEEEKFINSLEKGLKILHTQLKWRELKPNKNIENIPDISPINGFPGFTQSILTPKWLFDFYQAFGLDPDLVFEETEKHLSRKYTDKEKQNLISDFNVLMEKHREVSRAGAEKKFGGVGKEVGYESAKLHTATHLLHAALREVLGEHVKQTGSDISPQRLRFDFTHLQKLSAEELKKIEDLVNQKIKEDLEVKREEMEYREALKSGALAFFKEKYPERVTVYSVNGFSREVCAGPHVKRTGELGRFKIIKEESSGASIRRIRAILE